jgi:hypothetical protein
MRPIARTAYLVIALVLVAGLVVQVFLAGLGVFDKPASFDTHRDFGYILELLPILLVIVGAIGRLERRLVGLAALLFGLFLLQSVFVGLRASAPTIAALHPVNGFLILLVAIANGRGAWQAWRGAGVAAV